eukprot:10002905-Lingulodinium_polyedra.AAC.1
MAIERPLNGHTQRVFDTPRVAPHGAHALREPLRCRNAHSSTCPSNSRRKLLGDALAHAAVTQTTHATYF